MSIRIRKGQAEGIYAKNGHRAEISPKRPAPVEVIEFYKLPPI
jgi:hypothetical protein